MARDPRFVDVLMETGRVERVGRKFAEAVGLKPLGEDLPEPGPVIVVTAKKADGGPRRLEQLNEQTSEPTGSE